MLGKEWRCATCAFWDCTTYDKDDPDNAEGLCRVSGPMPSNPVDLSEFSTVDSYALSWSDYKTIWPTTLAKDWCGEYMRPDDSHIKVTMEDLERTAGGEE